MIPKTTRLYFSSKKSKFRDKNTSHMQTLPQAKYMGQVISSPSIKAVTVTLHQQTRHSSLKLKKQICTFRGDAEE